MKSKSLIELLLEKGVEISNPSSVEIGDEVNIDLISPEGVVIYPGCKIYGKKTLVMSGTRLGERSPVTIKNCQLGKNVNLKGGYFEESTFLDSANMGDGAEVRAGCLLEEQSNGSHTVGLKQTILFPFVTLGSIINFCDIFMAGGTSRKNHSEVGSSYIHFNYTPNQDKTTASLIGDVSQGVMLKKDPIFLGGQGGLVGPSRIGYGTVIAAGVIFRGDNPQGHKLLMGKQSQKEDLDFHPGLYWSVKRRILNSIDYIANVIALKQWYIYVRSKFFNKSKIEKLLYESAVEKLDLILRERIKRFKLLTDKMEKSIELSKSLVGIKISDNLIKQKRELFENSQLIEKTFKESLSCDGDKLKREEFLNRIEEEILKENGFEYLKIIQQLNEKDAKIGTMWLESIVEKIRKTILNYLPSFK